MTSGKVFFVWLAFLIFGGLALSDDTRAAELNFNQCAKTAGDYSQNPFALSPHALDELRLCILVQLEKNVSEPEEEKINAAINKNFSRGEK